MTSLSGLDALSLIGDALIVESNPLLTDEAVDEIDFIGGTVNISGN